MDSMLKYKVKTKATKTRGDMRVEIKIDSDIGETVAIIHTSKMTPELMALAEKLEQSEEVPALLFAKNENKMFAIEPEQIDIIGTEGRRIKLYNRDGQGYIAAKSLQELQKQLGPGFVRISKSTIINISRIDHLSPSFNRTMQIVMKNGICDYISRKYIANFKKRLGLLEGKT